MPLGVRTGHFALVGVRFVSLVIPRGFGVRTGRLESACVRADSLVALASALDTPFCWCPVIFSEFRSPDTTPRGCKCPERFPCDSTCQERSLVYAIFHNRHFTYVGVWNSSRVSVGVSIGHLDSRYLDLFRSRVALGVRIGLRVSVGVQVCSSGFRSLDRTPSGCRCPKRYPCDCTFSDPALCVCGHQCRTPLIFTDRFPRGCRRTNRTPRL